MNTATLQKKRLARIIIYNVTIFFLSSTILTFLIKLAYSDVIKSELAGSSDVPRSLSLEEALRIAKTHNAEIQETASGEIVANGQIDEANAGAYPKIKYR